MLNVFSHLKKRSATATWGLLLVLFCGLAFPLPAPAEQGQGADGFRQSVELLSSYGDRSTGSAGAALAARHIRERFTALGDFRVGGVSFAVPVLERGQSVLVAGGRRIPISPLNANVISPGTVPEGEIVSPLIYVGKGTPAEFNGRRVEGAVVLMEMASGGNWRHAAALGAAALVYVDDEGSEGSRFREKVELTPMDFPRFWMPEAAALEAFGPYAAAPSGLVTDSVSLVSTASWQEAVAENLYCIIPGSDEKLAGELVMVEAFYDTEAHVAARAPGADASLSIATLLSLGQTLAAHPPKRSVLLLATAGKGRSLAGMREAMWSLRSKARDLKRSRKALTKNIDAAKAAIAGLPKLLENGDAGENPAVLAALAEEVKSEVDRISRRLMHLRVEASGAGVREEIALLTEERFLLRRLGFRKSFEELTVSERAMLGRLIPAAVAENKKVMADARLQKKRMKAAKRFRSLVKGEYELSVAFSLHLSSHGEGVGGFNQGWLYPLKPGVSRVSSYGPLDDVMRVRAAEASVKLALPGIYHDSLRPSRRRSWESYLPDRPAMGGEVTALAGYLGVTLATVHDARHAWGTPQDTVDRMDWTYAEKQRRFLCTFLGSLVGADAGMGVPAGAAGQDKARAAAGTEAEAGEGRTLEPLHDGNFPRDGFATVTGKASLVRHGELFADRPAPGTTILAYQGPARYHAMVDSMGKFYLKGVASKKLVLGKVIIEGYRFDPVTGKVVWAIDKKQTGKSAYRVKMRRRSMKTDLVMFNARQTTLFNVLEPRSFKYMTKIQLIDGRREATPGRYWYSRIDTRASLVSSIYLEPGTPLKLTLSDSLLKRKMVLTNAQKERARGTGYRVDDYPTLIHTEYKVARDMWALLSPRVENLERHGIFDERIRGLMVAGKNALAEAEGSLAAMMYDRFFEESAKSWALAARVYDHVDKVQKDVLFGVLFYVALFIPFAFCMERLLFGFTDIHRRILAFFGILFSLVFVIYKVHPAFQLAYSPTVVILAFFIMGLSFMVTLIIVLRFEEEMNRLQRRAAHLAAEEISNWKAFVAAFFLGVTNLRRRRIRTALTCTTLIILTFTVMSFTSVKATRNQSRLHFGDASPYQGLLFKRSNWMDLPEAALGTISGAFPAGAAVAPRVWLEEENRTRSVSVPIRHGDMRFEGQGVIGLSAAEPQVTGFDRILVSGRWFLPGESKAVLLPASVAERFGIDPSQPGPASVTLWGVPFKVVGIFSGKRLEQALDLDGEALTSVTFPSEAAMEVTEVEMEAIESGEEVRAFQSRYQHAGGDLTLILPSETVLAAGGHLKAVAVSPSPGADIAALAGQLVDRFGITLFSGEEAGTFLYTASDALSYSGLPNIVIPILISVFIVLNTMIGSVYERKGEIGIYTSVGLAPSHVSFIFIAEALAFAVLSVVLGYLLAQVSAGLFANTPLWAGITVNYSSTAGVAAMFLVILVVLISVIYPSKVAARIAIPDVNRSWTLPETKDGALETVLPFLMSRQEVKSLGGYLLAWFKGHQDVSHGIFSTGGVQLASCPLDMGSLGSRGGEGEGSGVPPELLHLRMKLWLAPFDFGILQQVGLRFAPSSGDGRFWEIHVRLARESGEAAAWERINKVFLREMRKQLLVWRSLDTENRTYYETQIDRQCMAEEEGVQHG